MTAKTIFCILLVYCFISSLLSRESGINIPAGLVIEALLLLILVAAAARAPKENWKALNNELFFLFLFWFILSFLEVLNPAGASWLGWLNELRSVAVYPLLIVLLSFLLFNTNKDLDVFLKFVIILSTVAALNGIRQLHLGLSPGDIRFLQSGGAATHLLWGKLRVFSFYQEAAQFGASQAHISLMALILSFGPFSRKTKIILWVCSALMFYGMLISGTRGALFALMPGAFVAIILSKKFKVLIFGTLVACLFLGVLKFTYIGNGNYQIYRLRSALNPDDPSLNVRFKSQRILKEYMTGLPFGGGLGVTGYNGMTFNNDKFLSTVQPDSYWVKVWMMYGVVGLLIWLSMMTYLLGKCCGIVWKIKDEGLRVKAIALVSGFTGILIASYGNEVINNMPSSIVINVSLVFLFIMPKLEEELREKNIIASSKR